MWCAIYAEGMLGPYFSVMIKEEPHHDQRKTTTVTGENHLKMIENFFLPRSERYYFRQDKAPAHYARQVKDYLNQLFPDGVYHAPRSSGTG